MIDSLKARFQEVRGGRILDVATQNGQFIQRIINSFKDYREIIGIDIDERSVKKAQEFAFLEKMLNVGFLKMNSEHLDFVDNCFDVVCISNSLHHLKNLQLCLSEMKRVLRNGGYFIVAEMYSDVMRASQQSHLLFHHWAAKIDVLTGIYHSETFKRDEIIEIFDSLDLREKEILRENNLSEIYFEDNVHDTFFELIDKTLLRIKNHDEFQRIFTEGERIKAHIRKNGWESAPQIIIIGKKA